MRHSVDLNALERPALLFGDETSFALAHAMRFTANGSADVRMVFEATSKKISEKVLAQLGIANVDVVERTSDDSHLSEIEWVAVDHLQARSITSCALSGKASSIQRLNKRLRSLSLSSRQIRTRAYWAPGKEGLD
jgi:ferric-chelate reductase (NADPH)